MAQLHESLRRSGVFAASDLVGCLNGMAAQAVPVLSGGGGVVCLKLELAQ
jgi:hypothetical protein